MKKVLALLSAVVMMMAIAGCGGKTDEELLQGTVWQLTEISEEAPSLFPVSTAQAYLEGGDFKIEFLSDGSVLINAAFEGGNEYSSEAYYSYALVDGRIKISAPLGSTCISDYEITSKSLKLSDSTGYAVFAPFNGKDSAKAKTVESDASSEETSEETAEAVAEASEEDFMDNIAEVEPAADAAAVVAEDTVSAGSADAVVDDGTILDWQTVSYDDYNPGLIGDSLNKFYTVEDVKKLWEANTYGPGCYQPEIGLANCVYAWGVVGGDLRTRINVKLKDGYSLSDIRSLTPDMLDVTITDACYAWCPIDEGEEWSYEPLEDVTVDSKDITINNFVFNPDNPYIQIIIPDMYDAYNTVEAGQFYVVNWKYNA